MTTLKDMRSETIARLRSQGYQRPQAERMALILYPDPSVASPEATKTATVKPEPPAGDGHPASQSEMRAWAKSKGIPVSPKGSVSADVRAKYERAHRPRRTRVSK